MIPSPQECLDIMKEYNMLGHIVRHSLLVKRVAVCLAEELNRAGEDLDISKVTAGAFLHDIMKTRSIITGEDHAKAGGELLERLGFNGISEIVRQHVTMDNEINSPTVSEIEVVNYADKRVKHDKVVALEERFADIRKRYGYNEERVCLINLSEHNVMDLERKLFSRLSINSDALFTIP